MAAKRKVHEKVQVILLEDVRNLGKLGDQVAVRRGYGRNYLMPLRKAVPATTTSIAQFAERRVELEKMAQARLAEANTRAQQLNALTVKLKARAADEGKLYGSIGVRELAMAITEAGVKVGKSEVTLPAGPIRMLGEHDVAVQLHTDVEVIIKVQIEEEK